MQIRLLCQSGDQEKRDELEPGTAALARPRRMLIAPSPTGEAL